MDTRDIILQTLLAQLDEEDEFVRKSAVEELGELKEPRGIPGLVALLGKEKSIGVLEAAGNALARIGGAQTAKEIIPHLDSEQAVVRNLVCEVLVGIGADAVPLLLEELSDDDEDIRKFVVDVLGEIKDTRARAKLIEVLKDPCVNVACAAAESLGKIGGQEAVAALIDMVKGDNLDVGYYAVIALGKIDDDRAREILAQLLQNRNDAVMRFFAIEALGVKGNSRGVPVLASLIMGDDDIVQKTALKSLGRIDVRCIDEIFHDTTDEKLIRCVLSGLKDDDEEVQKYSLIALGMFDTALGLKELVALSEKEGNLTPFVVQDLIKIGKKNISILLDMVSNPKIREILPVILGDVQNRAAIGLLKGLLKDTSPAVRASAVRALGKLGMKEVCASLAAMLGDEDNDVKMAAATSLGWLGEQGSVGDLAALMEKSSGAVAEVAASSLVMIGGEQVRSALITTAAHAQELVREKAVQALGMLEKDGQVEAALEKALSDEAWNVRKAAVVAFEKYTALPKLEILAPLLNDANSRVRSVAVKLVGKIHDTAIIDKLAPLVNDPDPWVKYEVIRTFGKVRNETSIGLLLKALSEGGNIMKIAACEAFAELGYVEAQEAIRTLLDAKDNDVRRVAARTLERFVEKK